ncbi:hypothetical protein HBI67_003920 [Parastagonospora nodorum]|nr:hypothetical protein HBI67_003920 [Parastagonospora nodorum]KAH6090856.1 hypothetical protein HBI66_015710 [Parastagonospora nodorum]KAH6211577.1 hypothetical protein HBI53_113980 [Parastagonospora nodorum]
MLTTNDSHEALQSIMWTNNARYSREETAEGFQISPCLTASSGLLTPPSNYNLEARRNSAASSLSSLGPTTPIYGRFSDHGFGSVSAIEPCQDHSMETLAMGYTFKAPGHDSNSFGNWSSLVQPNGFEHAGPMRMSQTFVPQSSMAQSPMAAYTGVDSQSSSVPVSCATSFSSVSYGDYHGQLHDEADHVQTSDGIWPYQYALANMISAPTMAPNEALLGGEYIPVDTASHDTDMSSYDDADMPLARSPQDVTVKTEDPETSSDERRIRRSIWVSSTGGKSVKKEEQSGISKKKSRKTRSKAIPRLRDEHFEIWMDDDVEQIPGTKKWRRNGGNTSGKPQICKIEIGGMPCGRKFQRQEHLHRHEKTHSGNKPYVCQLCQTQFNRNDNCWEHYWTHVHRPGKKNGRNKKHSLKRVLSFIQDSKHIEKLHNKWRKEVGYEYDPETDPQALEEAQMEAAGNEGPGSSIMKHDNMKIRSKL